LSSIKILARALRHEKLQWDGQTDRKRTTKVSAVTSTVHKSLFVKIYLHASSFLELTSDGEDFDMKEDQLDKSKAKVERKPDTAVQEGRVIFLRYNQLLNTKVIVDFRNLSFDTSNDSLKESLSSFGEVALAIVCKFPGTDQPTGRAFVHFKDRESADKCLEELEVGFALKFLNICFVCLGFRPFH
jgi:hypothetical protein